MAGSKIAPGAASAAGRWSIWMSSARRGAGERQSRRSAVRPASRPPAGRAADTPPKARMASTGDRSAADPMAVISTVIATAPHTTRGFGSEGRQLAPANVEAGTGEPASANGRRVRWTWWPAAGRRLRSYLCKPKATGRRLQEELAMYNAEIRTARKVRTARRDSCGFIWEQSQN